MKPTPDLEPIYLNIGRNQGFAAKALIYASLPIEGLRVDSNQNGRPFNVDVDLFSQDEAIKIAETMIVQGK